MLNKKALSATAGAADKLYVEDVFSTYLYTGTGSSQTITNGIDLSGEGGMVWTKERSPNARNHFIGDSERDSFRNYLYPNLTNAQSGLSGSGFDISSISSTGYTLGADNYTWNNESGSSQVSWTFRKAEKFFDVVTYTGNGTAGRTVSHNLGSVPGCIIVKNLNNAYSWAVYHRSIDNTKALFLNQTLSQQTVTTYWNSTTASNAVFTLGDSDVVNGSGQTYVAYLFAHDAGGFGDSGSDNVIKCGSYTTDGSGNADIDLGWESQWFLTKRTDSTGNWFIRDNMRGWNVNSGSSTSSTLAANVDAAETSGGGGYGITSTGIAVRNINTNATFIYIAIRRGPMKTPEAGTEVFSPVAYTGTGATRTITAGFPVDLAIPKSRQATGNSAEAYTRLIGPGVALLTAYNFQELSRPDELTSFASNTGVVLGASTTSGGTNMSGTTYVDWNFRRAPGFFDVVCFTGDGTGNQMVTHNLGVTPELIITKKRSGSLAFSWYVYGYKSNSYLILNQTDAEGSATITAATSTQFSVFAASDPQVAYLFATCAGVSKVGSYTGTGTTQQINCGFTGGARFVLIKRADDVGDWYVWDTARGIVSGNDPYLLMNSTAAEVTNTDYIDTYSQGFEISSTAPAAINANGGTFIYLAIA